MKRYVVLLDYPRVYSQEIPAKNVKDLITKIDGGRYGILPVHGSRQIRISRNNIKMIYEQTLEGRLMGFAIEQVDAIAAKRGWFWSFYRMIMQNIYNLGRWDTLLQDLKRDE